jgi:hypothetical protein
LYVLATLGVVLILLGGLLRWRSDSPIFPTMLAIGGVCTAGGVVGVLLLTNGVAAEWAAAWALFAAFAAFGPTTTRWSFALLAVGMGFGCLDQVVTGSPMWLGTLTTIVIALGLAALVNAVLAGSSREPSV